jgi:hypothetical protein
MEKRLKKISKPAKILSLYQNQELIGSATDLNLDVFNDYDLQEYIEFNDDKKAMIMIEEQFKKKFKDAKDNEDIYITDFKCGFDKGGIPLRWNYNDMMKGYKYIDDRKIYFINCLHLKSTIKIDVLYIDQEGRINEISQNYYFKFGDIQTYNNKSIKELKTSLLIDFKNLYYDEKKLYKALKRLYSYYKITNNKTKINKLVSFFNSDVGYYSKLLSDLQSLILLIEQKFRKVKKSIIYNNISILYYDENNEKFKIYLKNLIENFKNLNIFQIKDIINEIIDYIEETINNDTYEFIKKNKIIK